MQDTGHVLFDSYGCGPEKRKQLDEAIGKELSFRKASEEMWGSLNVTVEEGLEELRRKLVIDDGFSNFLEFTKNHDIPFSVISAGIKPLLKGALEQFLGEEDASRIDIISNYAEISKDGSKWKPIWRHDCELGHDKALSIKEFRDTHPNTQLVFIGDGVSDLPAANQADLLFARRGLKLEQYCIEHKIPYIPYDSFTDIEMYIATMIKGNSYHNTSECSSTSLSPVASSPTTPLDGGVFSFESSNKSNNNHKRPMVMRTRSVGVLPTSKSMKVYSTFVN